MFNIFENQFTLVNRLSEDSIAVSILQDYLCSTWWLQHCSGDGYHGYLLMVMVILVIGGYQWLSMVISDTEK